MNYFTTAPNGDCSLSGAGQAVQLRIYGPFEKPSEKEKGYVLPRADGENGENCHVRRLGRRASSAGILQRPNMRGMMYYRKALELQAKDEGASQNFVMITSKTCVQIPESAFPKREFKMFNMQFDELHQRQSQWTVPDTELRKSLRLAVAEVLLPAYRSFLKLFGPLVESGKNSQRYIKYTAEDLERLLDELFEGKSMNEPRR
ncbi:hypothetical protein YC2023_102508 [Brassica napus]